MPISVERSLLIIVVCGLVVFTTRAIPFVLFSGWVLQIHGFPWNLQDNTYLCRTGFLHALPHLYHRLSIPVQEEFAAEFRKEYKDKDHCPCLKSCRYHGNCKECVAIHRAHQEHVPNCMRPLINKKLKLMSELTEHTLANEIEAPHEILRK